MHEVLDPVSSLERMESLLRAGQKGVEIMYVIVMIIIVGWLATLAMIGCCALSESGKLRGIRERIAWWRETSAAPDAGISDDGLESVDESAA
jgi:hypothetical protein